MLIKYRSLFNLYFKHIIQHVVCFTVISAIKLNIALRSISDKKEVSRPSHGKTISFSWKFFDRPFLANEIFVDIVIHNNVHGAPLLLTILLY